MEIMERQEKLEAVHADVFGGGRKGQSTPILPSRNATLDEEALIQKAMGAKNGRKFAALWSGDITGYHSRSEADLALCSLLSFWTGPDPVRIDRLFRQSGLYPGKWTDSYGARTIAKALEGSTKFYQPGKASTNGLHPQADAGPQATGEGTISVRNWPLPWCQCGQPRHLGSRPTD